MPTYQSTDEAGRTLVDGSAVAQPVTAGGVVSTANSSSTPLGAAGVFTGTFEDVLAVGHITIQVRANVASATDGLSIQWSADGVTAHDTDVFTVPANTGKVYTFGPQARYFRIVYTNGGTLQTSFSLHVIKKTFSQKPSSHRLQDMISNDDDAELTKGIVAARKDDGTFTNIGATNDSRLKVSAYVEENTLADLGQMFTTASAIINIGASGVEAPLLLIRNPSGSGKTIKFRNFTEGIISTNKPTTFRFYFNPTVLTNGTSLTAVNKLNGGSTVAVALATTQPTVSANGTQIKVSVVVAGVFVVPENFSLQLPANTSLLVTSTATVNNTEVTIDVDWAEV